MKRVLVVIPNLEGNGIASVVMNLYRSLLPKGVIYDFVCHIKPSESLIEEITSHGSKIYSIPSFSSSGLIKYINNLRSIMKNVEYNAIHVHTSLLIWISCLAAKRENIRIRVGHAHGQKFLNYPEWIVRFIEKPFRFLNRRYCTNMLTCTVESGINTFGKKVEFLANFVHPKDYFDITSDQVSKVREELNIPNDAYILGYIGSLDIVGVKNSGFFVHLLKRLKEKNYNIFLVVAGSGPGFQLLNDIFESEGLSEYVRLLGFRKDTATIMYIFDEYVCPSFTEGMSISLLQAQICQKPCIVSKGVPDVNNIGLGLFKKCETYEVEEWINKIEYPLVRKHSLSNEEVLQTLRKFKLDESCVIERLLEIY